MTRMFLAATLLLTAAAPALAQFSAGTGNPTNCSPGATNQGCTMGGGAPKPGTGNTTSQTNTGTDGNRSDTSHTTQQPGSNRSGAETGLSGSSGNR